MTKIVLIGGGNLAWHLAQTFLTTESISLVQMYNVDLEALREFELFTSITDDIKKLEKADLYIICISDHAIEEISAAIVPNNALVVHTSGATPMDVLNAHQRIGVFYPLQSFNRERKVNFLKIPICIEANSNKDLKLLEKLGKSLSKKVINYNSEQRKKIHLAAVFVNNFVNHLYHLGFKYLENEGIEPGILYPLIKETATRIKKNKPYSCQTGPAVRNDLTTFDTHLSMMDDDTMKQIYMLLSQSITNTYKDEL